MYFDRLESTINNYIISVFGHFKTNILTDTIIQKGARMRLISLEEHYGYIGISKAGEENLKKLVPDFSAAFGNKKTFELLFELDDERIKIMDEDHISVQVLSNTSAQRA